MCARAWTGGLTKLLLLKSAVLPECQNKPSAIEIPRCVFIRYRLGFACAGEKNAKRFTHDFVVLVDPQLSPPRVYSFRSRPRANDVNAFDYFYVLSHNDVHDFFVDGDAHSYAQMF